MSKGLPRDPRKEQLWRDHLARWQRSRLSVRAYCSRHGLSIPSFYSWRRTLAHRDAAAPAPASVTFVPLDLPPPPVARPLVEVVLRNGLLLRLPFDIPAAVARDLVAALEDAPC